MVINLYLKFSIFRINIGGIKMKTENTSDLKYFLFNYAYIRKLWFRIFKQTAFVETQIAESFFIQFVQVKFFVTVEVFIQIE